MKTPSTLYFQALEHNMAFLKEELRLLFPNWELTHEHSNFIICDVPREYSLEEICELPISFALTKGRYIGTTNAFALVETVDKVQGQWETTNVHCWDLAGDDQKMGDRKARGTVIDCFKLNDDHYYIGARFQLRGDFAPFSGASPIPGNQQAPTYHYQCLAEAFKRFRPLVAHDEVFLDIDGTDEAGRAYYLLEKGFRVVGVDPREASSIVRRDYGEDYFHLQENFLEITTKKLLGLPPLDWGVGRFGIQDKEKLIHLINILEDNDESKGLMLTFTVEKIEDVSVIKSFIEILRQSSFYQIKMGQVPSHQSEFSLVATRHVGTSVIKIRP